MDDGQALDTGIVEALKTANPEFEVGIDGIFHQHGDVLAAQRIGQVLHGKGIDHGASTNPEDVDAVGEGRLNVCGSGHFGGSEHVVLLFDALQPREAHPAHTFKATGLGAGFPDAGAEDFDAFGSELTGGA